MSTATTIFNRTLSENTETKYVNNAETYKNIEAILNPKVGGTVYACGNCLVWKTIQLPGGGSQTTQVTEYKTLKGIRSSYNINGFTLSEDIQPLVTTDSTTDDSDPQTSPSDCDTCSNNQVCFDCTNPDLPCTTSDEPNNSSAAANFSYSWNITNLEIEDGTQGTIINPQQYSQAQHVGSVTAVIGKKTETCPDQLTCHSTCECDPCGKLGYLISPAQCAIENKSSREVTVGLGPFLTCYECYTE
jgi:hypothetical protein